MPKQFDVLTPMGQLRRLRTMAEAALAHYNLDVQSLSLLSHGWNTLYRVDTPSERYVLRISRPNERDLTAIRSELWWLEALRRDTNLQVSEPVPARHGNTICTVQVGGVPEPRYCVLFRWMAGRHPRPSPRAAYLLGQTAAQLHAHADTFVPPEGFTRQRLDEVWTFGVPQTVYSDGPDAYLTPQMRKLLRETAARVEEAIRKLYSDHSGLRFLHIDLHFGNVKLQGNRLGVLDFDDSVWGYPIQDLGIALHFLLMHPQGHELCRAFGEGYTSLREWPEGPIELFVQARVLDRLNYFLTTDNPQHSAALPQILRETEERKIQLQSRFFAMADS